MKEAVICAPVRTAVGRYGGVFKGIEAHQLGAAATLTSGNASGQNDVASALASAGVALAQMDLIELNEAFAAQVLACTREWKFVERDFHRMNVNGSGISLGRPVGATGGRILSALPHELDRRASRYGLETMRIGGGQGISAVFERVAS